MRPLTPPHVGLWQPGDWAFLDGEQEACKVVDRKHLWGRDIVQVWLPASDSLEWVDASRLGTDQGAAGPVRECEIGWRAAAGRILDTLARSELVAPLEGLVTPLPHQIHALARAVAGDRIRFLLADEVGLGKTIEAGLILKELKTRGLVRRTLVVAPAGLTNQWIRELRTHFEEDFRLVKPGDFATIRRVTGFSDEENIWKMQPQVVVSLDAVKPVDGRRGWSREQLTQFNRERFEDLVEAGWDLVIIDEAHRIAGSTPNVARHRLGEALAAASPYLLLLSGTPHQGKTEAFRRLMGLLDPDVFPPDAAISKDRVAPFVIRTEKRRAVDAEGKPLFKKRDVRLRPIEWTEDHQEQRALYEAVTEYVREGYNQAMKEKQAAVGFLMVLMQRLVTSSTRAIRWALERRLEHLALPEGQLSLFAEDIAWDWDLRDSPEALEEALTLRLRGLHSEHKEVELLVSAARRCEARSPDVKAKALLDVMRELEQGTGDPQAKFLVFTEFVATQQMLKEYLEERGYEVAILNGSMTAEVRDQALAAFETDTRVLVSTEAGGEGLNLQFCHLVVNYDLPWNPMRLEQRIGRVDRIGQHRNVRAVNLALGGTVELRVQEVIEEKLKVILNEFGVDKLEDVLDSEQGDVDFDRLYIDALRDPANAEAVAERFLEDLRRSVREAKAGLEIFGDAEAIDPAKAREVEQHALPRWTEVMTVEWLRSVEGGDAQPHADAWRLAWPDGGLTEPATFHRGTTSGQGLRFLSLESPPVRRILDELRVLHRTESLVEVQIMDLPVGVEGTWSLWQVRLQPGSDRDRRLFPVFVTVDGRSLAPTARMLWDRLVQDSSARAWSVVGLVRVSDETEEWLTTHRLAESVGEEHFRDLMATYEEREREKKRRLEETFRLRAAAANQIAIDNIRSGKLRTLEFERVSALQAVNTSRVPVPQLDPLLFVRVRSG